MCDNDVTIVFDKLFTNNSGFGTTHIISATHTKRGRWVSLLMKMWIYRNLAQVCLCVIRSAIRVLERDFELASEEAIMRTAVWCTVWRGRMARICQGKRENALER
jgi:hypothetical protein